MRDRQVCIIDLIDLNQERGIFQVPSIIINDIGTKRWLIRFRENPKKERIKVICGESYNLAGVQKILGVSSKVTNKLCSLGLLRPKENNFSLFGKGYMVKRKFVSPLSLAQVISFASERPIEEILIDKDFFQKRKFLEQDPKERIKQIFQAFEGVSWFENLKLRVKRNLADQREAIFLRKNDRIRYLDLQDILGIFHSGWQGEAGALKKIKDLGLIIFQNGYKPKGPKNFVDTEALAQLISLFSNRHINEILLPVDKTEGYLTECFYQRRLIPSLNLFRLDPRRLYTISEGAKLLGLKRQTLYNAVKKATVKNAQYLKDKRQWLILGIDLMIYKLRQTQKRSFSQKDIADLFGITVNKVKELRLKVSTKGTFSRHHYVFPLYDRLAEKVRNKALEEYQDDQELIRFSLGDFSFCLTQEAQRSYCREYGGDFDETCLEHIKNELRNQSSLNQCQKGMNKIITPELVFYVEKITQNVIVIKRIKINTD